MVYVVGLGNPDTLYDGTRHNVGKMYLRHLEDILSHISAKATIRGFQSDAYMNDSGRFIRKILKNTSVEKLVVVHDDLDLRLGSFKIQKGVGPKVHYGIKSIEQTIGRNDFWRIRIGIDNRIPEDREQGEKYVLNQFLTEELRILEEVFSKIDIDLFSMVEAKII